MEQVDALAAPVLSVLRANLTDREIVLGTVRSLRLLLGGQEGVFFFFSSFLFRLVGSIHTHLLAAPLRVRDLLTYDGKGARCRVHKICS